MARENESSHYPSDKEVDDWIASVWALADATECQVEITGQNGFSHSLGLNHVDREFRYVRFSPDGMDDFYGYWQPAASGPAPLLFHVPGYGAEMSSHPDLVAQGFNVMHVSPLGYATPEGPDESKKQNGEWPVLPDTVTSGAQQGYRIWLANCILAIRWVMQQPKVIPNRISFFGTSQGGGASLLLGSLFRDHGVRCVAADVPFLTNYPLAAGRGAYYKATEGLDAVADKTAGWKALGYVDTISHARRLTIPTLLTAGSLDEVCPLDTIESLYHRLPASRSLNVFEGMGHRYSREFIALVTAWARLYA